MKLMWNLPSQEKTLTRVKDPLPLDTQEDVEEEEAEEDEEEEEVVGVVVEAEEVGEQEEDVEVEVAEEEEAVVEVVVDVVPVEDITEEAMDAVSPTKDLPMRSKETLPQPLFSLPTSHSHLMTKA